MTVKVSRAFLKVSTVLHSFEESGSEFQIYSFKYVQAFGENAYSQHISGDWFNYDNVSSLATCHLITKTSSSSSSSFSSSSFFFSSSSSSSSFSSSSSMKAVALDVITVTAVFPWLKIRLR